MEKLKVIYVWDAYCGWCYGFDSVLLPFLKAHPELEILTISGGLFAGDSVTSLGELGFIKKANESITEFMGTPFGDAYNTLLDEGTEMLNSANRQLSILLFESTYRELHWFLSSMIYRRSFSLMERV